eukprot:11550665-Alexandrium_andersonii.AAC.1
MIQHFAQAPEFCLNLARDEDLATGASYVSATNATGTYQEIRPPAGYYLALAAGPEILEDLPSEEPPTEKWEPTE